MSTYFQIPQHTIKTGEMAKRAVTSYHIGMAEVKLSENVALMLTHDLTEVETRLSQWGLMVVGLMFGAGDKTNASNDIGTYSYFRGVPSAFCSLPGIGWWGNIPLSEIDVYRVDDSSLKCGKVAYALTLRGGHARKVLIWFRKKIISYIRETNTIQLVPRNISDPTLRELYNLLPKIEKLIDEENIWSKFDMGELLR